MIGSFCFSSSEIKKVLCNRFHFNIKMNCCKFTIKSMKALLTKPSYSSSIFETYHSKIVQRSYEIIHVALYLCIFFNHRQIQGVPRPPSAQKIGWLYRNNRNHWRYPHPLWNCRINHFLCTIGVSIFFRNLHSFCKVFRICSRNALTYKRRFIIIPLRNQNVNTIVYFSTQHKKK